MSWKSMWLDVNIYSLVGSQWYAALQHIQIIRESDLYKLLNNYLRVNDYSFIFLTIYIKMIHFMCMIL